MTDKRIFDTIYNSINHLEFNDEHDDQRVALIASEICESLNIQDIKIVKGYIIFSNNNPSVIYPHTWIVINRQIYDPSLLYFEHKGENLNYVLYTKIKKEYSTYDYLQKYQQ